MNIGKIDKQVLKIVNTAKTVRKVELNARDYKHMKEDCYKFSEIMGQPLKRIQTLTEGADLNKYTFLRTMVNKFNYEKLHSAEDRSEHILNIYSMIDEPSALHLNIVRKSRDSFESLEKIFSLAKDEDALQFVEDMQYGELQNSKFRSKLIIDMLNSKNRDRYIANPERYSSYVKLNADTADAIKQLDKLIETGKYSRFSYDAKLAIQKLFKKQRVETAMAGKDEELEAMYTKERASFLEAIVKNFMPKKKAPQEETKSVVVDMYSSLDSRNAALRKAVVERFNKPSTRDKSAEIVEMQTLFNRIDKDNDAKIFVQKAINKDLKIDSIAELNEVLNTVPLKKANVFFNNAKRIIERSTGEERKTALVVELENPFFESKAPQKGRAKMVRMFAEDTQEDFLTRTYKIIENKINQYRYSRMSA